MSITAKRTAAISAIAYVLAWMVGLSTGVPNLALDASAHTITSAFSAHKTAAIMQFIFTEGLTGLFLALLVFTVWRNLQKRTNMSRLFIASGLLVGLISIVMCLLGLYLIIATVPHGNAPQVKHLLDSINRLDGPKMWLLALIAIGGVRMGLHLPTWLVVTGYALAIALFVSGLSYGLLLPGLAWSVYVSGVLLLLWVGSFGIIFGRKGGVATNGTA